MTARVGFPADNMSVSNMTGETILVRYSCDGTNPASNSATVVIPTRNTLPGFSFDMENETLVADSALGQVMQNEAWTDVGTGYDVSDKCGQTLTLRAKFDDTHFASLPETITVPLRGEKPAPVIDKETATIPNLTGAEYSTDNGLSWNQVPAMASLMCLTWQGRPSSSVRTTRTVPSPVSRSK